MNISRKSKTPQIKNGEEAHKHLERVQQDTAESTRLE